MTRTAHVHAEVLRYLEFRCKSVGQQPQQLRVLDYGCGDGKAVLELRQYGYQAFGTDISVEGIERARTSLTAAGYDADSLFGVVDSQGESPFADESFHFIYSQQVLEHVADLSVVARELHRLTAYGGYGLHVLTPTRRIGEPHLVMPFVHWLPKNRLRFAAILGWCLLGRGARPEQIANASPLKRAQFLYQSSITSTFYRSHRQVAAILQEAGHDTCFVTTNHRRLRQRPGLARIADIPMLRPLIDWVLLTFLGASILTRTVDDFEPPASFRFGSWVGQWQFGHAQRPARTSSGEVNAAKPWCCQRRITGRRRIARLAGDSTGTALTHGAVAHQA